MKKFLGTFATLAATGVYASAGVNEGNRFDLEYVVVDTAVTSSDTLELTLPEHLDPEYVPVSMIVWGDEDPVRLAVNDGVITSHNKDTGVTVLTPTTTWAIGDTVCVSYARFS